MAYAEISHTTQNMLAMARTETGIDIIDKEIEEPLSHLLISLNTEAKLSKDGAEGIQRRLLRVLCNRLRMQRDFLNHPEIESINVSAPVFITGAPRTGSTKLQKLLSASADFRYLKCWQGQSLALITGDRDEDPAERINVSKEEIAFLNHHAPKAKLVHEYSTFEPEEDVLIYEHFLFAPYFCSFTFVPGFVQWYVARRELNTELKFLKKSLQYLQWQFPHVEASRWLLKAPHYNGSEAAILDVFPDAKFVITHRNPEKMASSLPSFYANFYQAYSDADWTEMVGPMALNGLIRCIQLNLATRENNPEIIHHDICYSQLTSDIRPVIDAIYRHLEMPLTDASLQRMLNWENENTQHKLGVHQHDLDEFSLDKETVKTELEDYIKQFNHYF